MSKTKLGQVVFPPKKYELIAECTIEESTNAFIQNVDKDGKPFALTEMFAIAEKPDLSTDAQVCTGANKNYIGYQASVATKVIYTFCKMTMPGKFYTGWQVYQRYTFDGITRQNDRPLSSVGTRLTDEAALTSYYWYINGGIPVGSTVKIYGIRKE